MPSGEGSGKPFVLREWQKKFIRDIYTPHWTNMRRSVRRAVLSIARKNGKTALIAALVLVHLVGPEAINNGEIYSAANDRDQAAQIYKFAAQIVRADPELGQYLRCVDSTKTIVCLHNGSFYRAISAEAGTKHGLNPSLVIYDELAQSRNRELLDVLDTSMGAREEPLFITISTQSNDPEHMLSKMIDDGLTAGDKTTVVHLYAVPDDADIFDPKLWKLANPALGDFRSLDDFTALAERAKRMPGEEPKFRNLYLNQRFSASMPLITRKDWMGCIGDCDFEDGESVYLALDLSSTTDLTALSMVSDGDKDKTKTFFWKPEALVDEHSKRDFGAGTNRYREWATAGWLELIPGRSINPTYIAEKVGELSSRYQVKGLAFDRWRIADFRRALDAMGIISHEGDEGDGLKLIAWGQGFKDMAPAIDAMERSIIDGRLKHGNSPLLNWNIANATVLTDPAGNRKLDKEKTRFRIDGAVALAMALGLKARDMTAEGAASYLETSELLIL